MILYKKVSWLLKLLWDFNKDQYDIISAIVLLCIISISSIILLGIIFVYDIIVLVLPFFRSDFFIH